MSIDRRHFFISEKGELDEDRGPELLAYAFSFGGPNLVDDGSQLLIGRADLSTLTRRKPATARELRTQTKLGQTTVELALRLQPGSSAP